MLIRHVSGRKPRFGARVYVASNAVIVGDVTLEDDVSVWYNVVLRGDIHRIKVGARSNVQDGAIVHVEHDAFPTILGEDVTVGHGAILHGCTIGRGALIGIGALVLNGAEVGEQAVVAAGSVVREGQKVAARTLVAGVPAEFKRELSKEDLALAGQAVPNYLGYKSRFLVDGEDMVVDQVSEAEGS